MHLIGSCANFLVTYVLGSSLSFQSYKKSTNQQPGAGFV